MRVMRATVLALSACSTLVFSNAPAVAGSGFSTAPVSVAPTSTTQTVITGIRVGQHVGYDRVVFDLNGPIPGYQVSYVSQVLHDGSGKLVPLSGTAFLRVVIRSTSTTVFAPQGTITPMFAELRQVKGAGDFEAVTSYGLGLATRAGFRVFTLSGPNRLVVDVASSTTPTSATGALPFTGIGLSAAVTVAVGSLFVGIGLTGWCRRRTTQRLAPRHARS